MSPAEALQHRNDVQHVPCRPAARSIPLNESSQFDNTLARCLPQVGSLISTVEIHHDCRDRWQALGQSAGPLLHASVTGRAIRGSEVLLHYKAD